MKVELGEFVVVIWGQLILRRFGTGGMFAYHFCGLCLGRSEVWVEWKAIATVKEWKL